MSAPKRRQPSFISSNPSAYWANIFRGLFLIRCLQCLEQVALLSNLKNYSPWWFWNRNCMTADWFPIYIGLILYLNATSIIQCTQPFSGLYFFLDQENHGSYAFFAGKSINILKKLSYVLNTTTFIYPSNFIIELKYIFMKFEN